MKKKILLLLIGIVMILSACSLGKKIVNHKENNGEQEVIVVPQEVNALTVTGNGFALFSETEDQLRDRKVVFEHPEEIEVLLTAINASSQNSGPVTSEGENFKITLTYNDGTSETILLWLYPDRNTGRIQKENNIGPIYLLSKEDVQSIAKLLDKKTL